MGKHAPGGNIESVYCPTVPATIAWVVAFVIPLPGGPFQLYGPNPACAVIVAF